MRYRKDDVTFHADYMRDAHAAVNVKNYGGWSELRAAVSTVLRDEGYIPATGTDLAELTNAIAEDFGADEFASMDGWDQASMLAEETFGQGYAVASEGRSGGWLVVTYGRYTCFDQDEVAGWDAIALTRWATFEARCRAIADDQAYRVAWGYIVNRLEPARADVASFAAAGVGL